MKAITSDTEAWIKYPFHRNWFNKLWVSEQFGYACGPNCIPVPVAGEYIVRPIYNLHGMGAGASFVHLEPHNIDSVPPGSFWCEKFQGPHHSVDLQWDKRRWVPRKIYQGIQEDKSQLFRFAKWVAVDSTRYSCIEIPKQLNGLWDCQYINIEMIGDKIIEVHLRGSPDPQEYQEVIPVWNDTPKSVINQLETTHTFVNSYDHVYGTSISRIGFFCK